MFNGEIAKCELGSANLSEANITAEQLLQAKTLYKATLDGHIREEILRRKPELLDYLPEERNKFPLAPLPAPN